MSEKHPQTFANHGRIDPWYHFVAAPLLLLCFCFSIYLAVRMPDATHLWLVVLAFGVLLVAGIVRPYALKVQDRVIRLEEQLRLSALLPEPLRARIPELSEKQLVALRFAADAEVPSLVEKVFRENLEPKAIKKEINTWRPDYWRI